MDDLQYEVIEETKEVLVDAVLNLVINGWPSIRDTDYTLWSRYIEVLNLVINGWPSIQKLKKSFKNSLSGFKPCYKWMTFNT